MSRFREAAGLRSASFHEQCCLTRKCRPIDARLRAGGTIAGCEMETFICVGAGFVGPAADLPSVRRTHGHRVKRRSPASCSTGVGEGTMEMIAITRLRIRAWRFLPVFFWHTRQTVEQARRAPGFLGGRLGAQRDRTFWTLTAWIDEDAMRAYRASGAHRAVMPKLAHWCDEAAVGHWPIEAGAPLPDWETAYQRMTAVGRLTPIKHPSERHQAGVIAALALLPHSDRLLRPLSADHGGSERSETSLTN